jgi:predicted lipid-binding transport protein (Tim44 family)
MRVRTSRLTRLCWLSIVTVAAVALLTGLADARPGGGGSFGSRGGRTFSTPPTTNTAPKAAAPIDRSMTQPGKSATAQGAQAAPGAAAQASRFGGWRGLLLGGLIGAGLASLFGMGGLAHVLGFLLQVALIGGIVWLAVAFFRSRAAQPALATASASGSQARQNASYRAAGALGGAGSPLTIGPNDYDAFERLLGEIQTAFGRNDIAALGDRATPEMLSYFAAELDANSKQGLRNEVSQPKLLQGDLAEAWREADGEYATVAMRYSLIDTMVEAASGRPVSGSKTQPEEVTELWTFRRPGNGTARQWELSAIQQA